MLMKFHCKPSFSFFCNLVQCPLFSIISKGGMHLTASIDFSNLHKYHKFLANKEH